MQTAEPGSADYVPGLERLEGALAGIVRSIELLNDRMMEEGKVLTDMHGKISTMDALLAGRSGLMDRLDEVEKLTREADRRLTELNAKVVLMSVGASILVSAVVAILVKRL